MTASKAVFFTADNTYLPLAWTAARTVASEAERDFDVWLLVPEDLARTTPPPGARLLPINLPGTLLTAGGPSHMSAFAYARLAAPTLWLRDYERLLYIDSDTRIIGPLAPLFRLEMGETLAAMVEDCGRYLGAAAGREDWNDYRRQIGLPIEGPYFNSGVILMNASLWRRELLWERASAFIARHGSVLRFMDQDALNVLAAKRVLELSPRWNFCTHYMGLGLEETINPHILHYLNVLKPWRDPEWATLYGQADMRAFAELFKDTPWPDFMHPSLCSMLPWRRRAALRAARKARHVPEAALVGHIANFSGMAPRLWRDVRAGFADGAARYADLSAQDARAWRAAMG
ncbi:glycosyltransferase family 8 protein [Acidocella sp.]|uniref:glycosyltransferase family 8 protein n=1 Tax=Acidocella sp. TaxID=50710 RepID=UPI003D0352DC